MLRFALVFISLAACGSKPHNAPDPDGAVGDAATSPDDGRAPAVDTAPADAFVPPIDAFPAVLDLRIDCHNDCVLVANPAAIAVAAGTAFEVNWINVGDTECDVAKIDAFNQVPIIIGLEPGTSYHDDVRQWCGQFTGTFQFRVSICTLPSFIPVDCDLAN